MAGLDIAGFTKALTRSAEFMPLQVEALREALDVALPGLAYPGRS